MTLQPAVSLQPPILQPERLQDAAAVDALVDHAFGPGRFTKVSERVRERATFAPELSFCAWQDDRLVGAVRQWRVAVGGQPVVFLGPLAVDAQARSGGLGRLLVARACEAAAAAGEAYVLLVGDEPFFAQLGFSAALAALVRMPGPVDPGRVLARRLDDTASTLVGAVGP